MAAGLTPTDISGVVLFLLPCFSCPKLVTNRRNHANGLSPPAPPRLSWVLTPDACGGTTALPGFVGVRRKRSVCVSLSAPDDSAGNSTRHAFWGWSPKAGVVGVVVVVAVTRSCW